MKIKNIGKHFRTITEHKVLVMKECFKLGRYRRGRFSPHGSIIKEGTSITLNTGLIFPQIAPKAW